MLVALGLFWRAAAFALEHMLIEAACGAGWRRVLPLAPTPLMECEPWPTTTTGPRTGLCACALFGPMAIPPQRSAGAYASARMPSSARRTASTCRPAQARSTPRAAASRAGRGCRARAGRICRHWTRSRTACRGRACHHPPRPNQPFQPLHTRLRGIRAAGQLANLARSASDTATQLPSPGNPTAPEHASLAYVAARRARPSGRPKP